MIFHPYKNQIIYGERNSPDSLSEFTQLIHLNLGNGTSRKLNDPELLSPQHWTSSADGSHVYFTALERGNRNLYRVGVDSGSPHEVITEDSISHPVLKGESMFFLSESLFRPAAVRVSDVNGRHQKQLSILNDRLIAQTRVGSIQEIGGREGSELVHSLLILPPGFRPDRRWPVLIVLHGGPHQSWINEFRRHWNPVTLSAPGYIVVAPNPVGSTGYGQAYAQALEGDPVTVPSLQIMQLTDHLERLDYVDSDRIALLGFSYGGYLANWLNTQTTRYKTVVSHAGAFDLVSQYGSDYPWGREHTYGVFPWNEPQRLVSWSPSTFVKQIKTPSLFLHGEKDTRVAPIHSRLGHNLLTGLGVRSRLVLFPDEGHNMIQPATSLLWWENIQSWLSEQVGAGPASSGN